MGKVRLSWMRIALALLLAPALLSQSVLVGAAGVPAPPPASSSVETANASPIVAQWSITWTMSSRYVSDIEGQGGAFINWDYALTQSGSTIVRQYADGTWDNTSFKWHVTSDDEEAMYYDGGAWADCVPDMVYEQNSQSITDPDRYSGTLTHVLNVTTQRLPDGTWQASIPFDTLLGLNSVYLFTLSSHGSVSECGVTTSKDTVGPYNPSWSFCSLGIPATLVGDDQGNDFTYHDQFNGLYTNGKCEYSLNGTTASLSVDVAVHRLMGTDLLIRHLEVTQAVQDDANSIPLVQGRSTVVRAFIGLGESPDAIPNVTAKLTGYSDTTELGTIAPFNPNQSITAPLNPDWMNLNDTLNFALPLAWTTLPELTLKVEVNPSHTIQEANYNNNDLSVDVVTRACSKVTIGYTFIHYTPPGGWTPSDPTDNVKQAQVFMQKIYPVPDKGIVYTPLSLEGTMTTNINDKGNNDKFLAALTKALKESTPPRPDHIFGWLPSLAYAKNGRADNPGTAAFGNNTMTPDMWRRTFAHEIGHNFSLNHPPIEDPLTTEDAHWFDVYDRVIKPVPATVGYGNNLFDMMVAARLESEAWISPTNYTKLMGYLCAAPGKAAATESSLQQVGDNLIVSGSISNTTPVTGTLDPLTHLSTIAASTPSIGSQYCVNLEDNSGTSLSKYCFDVSFDDDSDTPESAATFSMVVPYPTGLNRVELTQTIYQKPANVLSSQAASAHPPSVTVTYPNASGLTLSGSQAITWTGLDTDHDSLTYDILYSRDNGVTWTGVAADLTGTSLTFDFSTMPGTTGASGLIRVLASDGFYTALDTSNNPFTVGNKPPSASILSPSSGATFTSGPKVVLEGSGADLEDGSLGDSALSWVSSKDGALGTGQALEVNLTPGDHTITLTVTDSKGLTDTTSIQVTVVQTTTSGHQQYVPFVRK